MAFTSVNASAGYATFYDDLVERKQAEFLIRDSVPWKLVTRIGVICHRVQRLALSAVSENEHRPPVNVITDGYF